MKLTKIRVAFLSSFCVFAMQASAQTADGALSNLKQMKVATTDLDIPLVPQTGKNADAFSAPGGAAVATGSTAVGWRAANAGDCPRPDGHAGAADHG